MHIVRGPFATIGFRAMCTEKDHYIYEAAPRILPSDGPPTCLWCVAGVQMS